MGHIYFFIDSMNHSIVEIAEVSIKNGVQETDFIEAAQKVHEEFLSKQPGFIGHDSYKSPEGNWVDLVYWTGEEEANRAAQLVMQSDTCLQWLAMMDEKSLVMKNLRLIKRW